MPAGFVDISGRLILNIKIMKPITESYKTEESNFFMGDMGDVFSGFIKPGSRMLIAENILSDGNSVYLTNTGNTQLVFYLTVEVSGIRNQFVYMLSGGKSSKIYPEDVETKGENFLDVVNPNLLKEGSFFVLVAKI
jgi:hypothetical protein